MVKKTNTWRAAYHQLGPMTGDLPLQSYNLYTSKSKFFLKIICKIPIFTRLFTENSWLFYYFFHSFHPFHYIRVFPPIFHPAVENTRTGERGGKGGKHRRIRSWRPINSSIRTPIGHRYADAALISNRSRMTSIALSSCWSMPLNSMTGSLSTMMSGSTP